MVSLSAIDLYPYQKKWILDSARFKEGRWARQTGKSFCCAAGIVLDSREIDKNKWIAVSSGERQVKEFMEKIKLHAEITEKAITWNEETFGFVNADGFKEEYKVTECTLRNGSKIIGVPANPDTARGYSANVYLDEFSVHKNSRDMWAAVFPIVSRGGFKLWITYTPKGKQNKAYEISNNTMFSHHVLDIYEAVKQGCPHDIEILKSAIDDPDLWAQEYEVQFLDEATAFITYDMINECESDMATINNPLLSPFSKGEFYVGMDIGRRRDLTVIWVLEIVGDVLWTREVIAMLRASFSAQEQEIDRIWKQYHPMRLCVDQTGMGEKFVEDLQKKYSSSVEGVLFSAPVKLDLANTLRRKFEDKLIRIPIDKSVRDDIHSVKKITTSSGNIRFDAERTEQGHCYDEKTDILTNEGWKSFPELSYSDKVASLEGEELIFSHPNEIQSFTYKGEMIRIINKQVDLLVTPNHKLFVQMPYKEKYEFIEADAIKNSKSRIKFKKDAKWNGKDMPFYVAGYEIPSEIWAEFMGYFISQGFTSTQNRIGIYNNNIEQTPIKDCLEKLPWKFWREGSEGRTPSYRTQDNSLWSELNALGKQPDRYIPREILYLPADKLKIFFNALMFGNGRKGLTTWSYYSSSYRLASDMQELLLKIGIAGSITTRQMSLKGKNKRTLYEVNINRTRLRPQINKRRKSISIEKYDGEVFCCTVPSGVIYVRREGKAVWCGNSDRFWALALATHAASNPSGPIEFEVAGTSRAFTKMGGY